MSNQENVNVETSNLIDTNKLKNSAMVLRALNHKLRQQIMAMINDAEKINVTEIYVKLKLEQSVASQHLGILRKAGVVKPIRDGKMIYYSIDKDRLNDINKFISELVS